MAQCVNCSAELRPEWRFCVYCGAPTTPDAVPPESVDAGRVNPLAVLALVLAAIGGFPALVFGHLALAQIKRTGERGRTIALVATVLGYVWLVVGIVLLFAWLGGAI